MKDKRGSGQFRYRVTVEKPKTSGANSLGEIDLSSDANWVFVAERRAAVIPVSGREYRQDHQQKSTRRYMVRVLGDTTVRQIIATWRFKWNDKGTIRRLNVIEGELVQEMPEIYEFDCMEST